MLFIHSSAKDGFFIGNDDDDVAIRFLTSAFYRWRILCLIYNHQWITTNCPGLTVCWVYFSIGLP
jgi:hypothetical protein